MSLRVLSIKNGTATISIPAHSLKDVMRLIENFKTNQDETKSLQYIKFLRRVIPFFMNQFLHWTNQNGNSTVVAYLKALQRKKKSKQKKFECGDLRKIFSSQKQAETECQMAWQQFLQQPAYTCVTQNNKISTQDLKEQYVDSISLLRAEISKFKPYDRFLSKNNAITLESVTMSIDEEFSDHFSDRHSFSNHHII